MNRKREKNTQFPKAAKSLAASSTPDVSGSFTSGAKEKGETA